MMRTPKSVAGLVTLLVLGMQIGPSAGQSSTKECAIFQKAVAESVIIAKDMLRDWKPAVPCLAGIIGTFKPSISKPADAVAQKSLLGAVKAARVMLDENGAPAIELFRQSDDLNVISVLSFAGRSTDFDVRLNSTLVLGNVIDNSSVCVPLDHLYDPEISANGRANLLAVVSVVIPWARKENVSNIKTMLGDIEKTLPPNSPDTKRIVEEMKAKLAKREPEVLNDGPSAGLLSQCRAYKILWAQGKVQY